MKEQSKIILSIEEMDEEHFKQDNPATDQEEWDAGASLYGYLMVKRRKIKSEVNSMVLIT